MKRILLFGLVSALIFWACGSETIAPLAERIQKLWSVQVVKENSTTTFTKGASTNTRPGYSAFRLDLSSTSTVVFVDFDGTRCTGTWEVSSDEKRLILKDLSPQPTGTNGTIEFTITEATDAKLVLTRTTASQKTGGTINVYELIVG